LHGKNLRKLSVRRSREGPSTKVTQAMGASQGVGGLDESYDLLYLFFLCPNDAPGAQLIFIIFPYIIANNNFDPHMGK